MIDTSLVSYHLKKKTWDNQSCLRCRSEFQSCSAQTPYPKRLSIATVQYSYTPLVLLQPISGPSSQGFESTCERKYAPLSPSQCLISRLAVVHTGPVSTRATEQNYQNSCPSSWTRPKVGWVPVPLRPPQ